MSHFFSPTLYFSGSRYPSQGTETENSPCTKSPAFRTGSEPNLSPLVFRRFASELQISDALRGSDSQLHLRPPPKPFLRPLQGLEVLYCELNATLPTEGRPTKQSLCPTDSFVEHLTTKDNGTHSSLILDDGDSLLSSVDPHTAQLEINKECPIFVTPAIEKVSSFRPNHFESKLLPLENKPLETTMLKKVKELFVNNDAKVIAQHILKMDCKVKPLFLISTRWVVVFNSCIKSDQRLIWCSVSCTARNKHILALEYRTL